MITTSLGELLSSLNDEFNKSNISWERVEDSVYNMTHFKHIFRVFKWTTVPHVHTLLTINEMRNSAVKERKTNSSKFVNNLFDYTENNRVPFSSFKLIRLQVNQIIKKLRLSEAIKC